MCFIGTSSLCNLWARYYKKAILFFFVEYFGNLISDTMTRDT